MTNLSEIVAQLFERFRWAEDVDSIIEDLKAGSYGDPIPYIATYLNDASEAIQTYAIHSLMLINHERAFDYILPLLEDPDKQFLICYWLVRHGTERTVIPLTQLLEWSSSPDTRFMAAVALRNTGDERALPALRYTYEHDDGYDHDQHSIREMAAEAITTIRLRAS